MELLLEVVFEVFIVLTDVKFAGMVELVWVVFVVVELVVVEFAGLTV